MAYKGKNAVSAFFFFQSSLIVSLSNLQVMRTGIKSRISSKLGCVGVIRPWAFSLILNVEFSSVTMNSVFIKLTGNEDTLKSSNEFEVGQDQDYSLWSYSPLSEDYFTYDQFRLLSFISEGSTALFVRKQTESESVGYETHRPESRDRDPAPWPKFLSWIARLICF